MDPVPIRENLHTNLHCPMQDGTTISSPGGIEMKVKTLRLLGTVAVLCLLCGCYAQPDQVMVDREESPPDPQTALPSGPQVEDRKPLTNRPANSRLAGPQDVSYGTTEATVIDTRNFANQIYRDGAFTGEQKSTNIFRPVKSGKPDLQAGPPNNLTSGGVAGDSIVRPQAAFPGISASPWTPPDSSLAAGPKHVIQTVNMETQIQLTGDLSRFVQAGSRTISARSRWSVNWSAMNPGRDSLASLIWWNGRSQIRVAD